MSILDKFNKLDDDRKYNVRRRYIIENILNDGLQTVETPDGLIEEMVSKIDLDVDNILIMFNVEIVNYLIYKCGVDRSKIYFTSDSNKKNLFCTSVLKVNYVDYDKLNIENKTSDKKSLSPKDFDKVLNITHQDKLDKLLSKKDADNLDKFNIVTFGHLNDNIIKLKEKEIKVPGIADGKIEKFSLFLEVINSKDKESLRGEELMMEFKSNKIEDIFLTKAGKPDALGKTLIENGYDTIESLSASSDDELLAIKGIAKSKLEKIRNNVKSYMSFKNNVDSDSENDINTSKRGNMKFDVIIGNPPYQSNGKSNKLWNKFIKKAIDLNPDKILMITPNVWWKAPSKTYSNIEEDMIEFGVKEIHTNYNNYEDRKNVFFSDIGDDIGWFILEKDYKGLVSVDNDEELEQEYSLDKKNICFNDEDLFIKRINKKMSIGDRLETMYGDKRNFIEKGSGISDIKTSFYNIKVYDAKSVYYVNENDCVYKKSNKKLGILKGDSKLYDNVILLNTCGYYYDNYSLIYKKIKSDEINGNGWYGIKLNSDDECNNLISYVSSKLYLWYVMKNKSSGFQSKEIKNFPYLDVSHPWTDEEVYKHFNITEDEIKTIEEDLEGVKSI